MRKVAANMARNSGGEGGDASECSSSAINCGFASANNNNGTGAVGNTLIGGDGGSGVSSITFDQHSMLVRYPNSMSNLRRLRCYLLACQVFFLVLSRNI
jgi:hypothetical protein